MGRLHHLPPPRKDVDPRWVVAGFALVLAVALASLSTLTWVGRAGVPVEQGRVQLPP